MFPHLFKINRLQVKPISSSVMFFPLRCLFFSAAGWMLGTMPTIAQSTPNTASRVDLSNQAEFSYEGVPQVGYSEQPLQFQGKTGRIEESFDQLVDPLGRVVGCNGEVLTDYSGFSVAFYESDSTDPTGASLGRLVQMTRTELPDLPNNIPAGLAPNIENANPYFITNGTQGTYNFLLDPSKGQLDSGRSYILVVNPPANSIYSQRRLRIVIGTRTGNTVSYSATALDGKAISTVDGKSTVNGTLTIADGATTALALTVFDLSTNICQAQEIQITKTGDRATASPGDTVIYRLAVRNLASAPVTNLEVIDNFPVGFKFVPGSERAEFQGTPVAVTATPIADNSLKFTLSTLNLPAGTTNRQATQILNIAYAATLTPDAIRGTGRNLASVQGIRTDNGQIVKDGPSSHLLRLTPGLLSDCGTIIGRVFEDKNFDGEQQNNEPGIPNAVVILDDGNRITTDANGLFSVANVQPGYRTGVLDFSSLPGYTIAPNRKFKERNSQSRLVNLAPSGMVRMNFAVTPAFQEVGQ